MYVDKRNKYIIRNTILAKAVANIYRSIEFRGTPLKVLDAISIIDNMETRLSLDTHKAKSVREY